MLVLLSPGGRITVASGAEALVAEVLVEAISGCTCPLDVLSLLVLGLLFCLLNQALMSILASCCAKLPTDLLLPKLKLLISNLERHLLFVWANIFTWSVIFPGRARPPDGRAGSGYSAFLPELFLDFCNCDGNFIMSREVPVLISQKHQLLGARWCSW